MCGCDQKERIDATVVKVPGSFDARSPLATTEPALTVVAFFSRSSTSVSAHLTSPSMKATRSRDNDGDDSSEPVRKSRKVHKAGDEDGDIWIKAADGKKLQIKAYHLQSAR